METIPPNRLKDECKGTGVNPVELSSEILINKVSKNDILTIFCWLIGSHKSSPPMKANNK